MSKKTAILIFVALVLGAVSLFLWLDSRPPSKIQIAYRIVPTGRTSSVVFYLDPAYPMTRIKVTSVAEAETNQHPHALWEIIPENKPVTKTEFIYGENIPGMKAFIPGTQPEPLDPDSKYFLLVSFAKNVRGECTFNSRSVGRR
jgi:hypothetical protein